MHNEQFKTNKNINDVKIALFSDIHYYPGYNTKIFSSIIKQIKKSNPDYVCITGDILDRTNIEDMDTLFSFLKEISTIAPTLVVLGNHDLKHGRPNHWKHLENNKFINELKKINNLYLLEDTIYTDTKNNISFYGFNLSYKYYEETEENYDVFAEEVQKLKAKLNEETYNITLFHSPTNIYRFISLNPTHELNKTDLILSGHMHNGGFPFSVSYILNKVFKTNRGIINPVKKFFPKYSHGKIKHVKDGYIHEGITKLSHSTKPLHIFDKMYQKRIEIINIKKDK